jgi:hypothetical protein
MRSDASFLRFLTNHGILPETVIRPREDVMRTFVVSTIALLLLGGIAISQQIGAGENANTWVEKQDSEAARAAVEREKQKQLDAQYKAALGRTKTPIAPSDPWGNVRSVNPPATGH